MAVGSTFGRFETSRIQIQEMEVTGYRCLMIRAFRLLTPSGRWDPLKVVAT